MEKNYLQKIDIRVILTILVSLLGLWFYSRDIVNDFTIEGELGFAWLSSLIHYIVTVYLGMTIFVCYSKGRELFEVDDSSTEFKIQKYGNALAYIFMDSWIMFFEILGGLFFILILKRLFPQFIVSDFWWAVAGFCYIYIVATLWDYSVVFQQSGLIPVKKRYLINFYENHSKLKYWAYRICFASYISTVIILGYPLFIILMSTLSERTTFTTDREFYRDESEIVLMAHPKGYLNIVDYEIECNGLDTIYGSHNCYIIPIRVAKENSSSIPIKFTINIPFTYIKFPSKCMNKYLNEKLRYTTTYTTYIPIYLIDKDSYYIKK